MCFNTFTVCSFQDRQFQVTKFKINNSHILAEATAKWHQRAWIFLFQVGVATICYKLCLSDFNKYLVGL